MKDDYEERVPMALCISTHIPVLGPGKCGCDEDALMFLVFALCVM